MMKLSALNLSQLMSHQTIATQHREALGEGWLIAEEFLGLHLEALTRISRSAGRDPGISTQLRLGIGGHSANLFFTILDLLAKGLFDVAVHLHRGLFDCHSLLEVVGDTALANQFDAGNLRPSDARKMALALLRENGYGELADDAERILLQEKEIVDDLAHVKAYHLILTQSRGVSSVTPTALGRFDARYCQEQWLATLRNELLILTILGAAACDEDWNTRLAAAKARFSAWYKTVSEANEVKSS